MISSNLQFCNYNFNGGSLSSDGGSVLLSSFIRKTNLLDGLKETPFSDSRKNPAFSNFDILKHILNSDLLGYATSTHRSSLKQDPLCDPEKIPSQPTESRFYDRILPSTNAYVKHYLQKTAIHEIARHTQSPLIDCDSTGVETYGNQEGSAWITHYKMSGFHPLVFNEYETALLLSASLRCGNCYSSNGTIEQMQEFLPLLKEECRGQIFFRGDSAFYDSDLCEYLEENDVQYYIRCKGFNKLTQACLDKIYDEEVDLISYTAKSPYYSEIQYKIGHSKECRRVIFKAYTVWNKYGERELFPAIYCVVTNCTGGSPKEIMDFYEERGNSENYTKELKDDFSAGTLSHREFEKNEFDFLLRGIAYNLFKIFQLNILEGTDKRMRMNSYRLKYQKIAVRVIKHARKIGLNFSSSYQYKDKFKSYMDKIIALA